MLTGLLANASSIRKVSDVLATCKKIKPTSRVETPEASLQKELERLALSAPHMLADIGFERDPRACTELCPKVGDGVIRRLVEVA